MSEDRKNSIIDIRKACRQFALLYYHFCKTLYEGLGEEKALDLARQAIFSLSCDRAGRMRVHAEEQGLPLTLESFMEITDLPVSGWTEECGGMKCPYAEVWVSYYEESPWFRTFASQFCDVIDTTNIEVFSGSLSHKITSNLVWGDSSCEREYFPSEEVSQGKLTYGTDSFDNGKK